MKKQGFYCFSLPEVSRYINDINSFSSRLIAWYRKNKRDLPWRNTRNPYRIWLSEIILQQTRVDQGRPYYEVFVKNFPRIEQLAAADEKKVLKLWQGLGYYSRARNLHATAKKIVSERNGKFPTTYGELVELKGIGDYTASAIASFAYGQPTPVVDGNVYRVLSRLFGIRLPIDSPAGKKEFKKLADRLIDKKRPGEFNQAIMEFGALQCKPAAPDCKRCPFSGECVARKKKIIQKLPVKAPKLIPGERFIHYFVIRSNNTVLLNRRSGNDIWKGLYDFPAVEFTRSIRPEKLTQTKEWKKILGKEQPKIVSVSNEFRHQLSHQTIVARFWEIATPKHKFKSLIKQYLPVTPNQLSAYAVPRLIEKYLDSRSEKREIKSS